MIITIFKYIIAKNANENSVTARP